MKDIKNIGFEDLERVPRMEGAVTAVGKRARYSAVRVKSCTVTLNRGVHGSRPLSEVIGWESM